MHLRERATYVALAVATLGLGLAVRFGGMPLLPATRDVAGDFLWAAMLAWWVGAVAPRLPLGVRAAVSLAGCYAVELSQLYHTPFLDALRRTTAGHLVLGSGFDRRDLLAYAAGVLVAALLEAWWRHQHRHPRGRGNPG